MREINPKDSHADLPVWFAQNQDRITTATLAAINKILTVREVLSDLKRMGKEAAYQKLDSLIFAIPSLLLPCMAETFREEFSDVSDTFREALIHTTELAVKEYSQTWIDLVIQNYIGEHPEIGELPA